ncbi:hypothetical protein LWF01_02740 [Saxibacter everestensis]|uniref:Uncharacterized protein n=1 Tax=Saxibacter everestensis TaxID=2909229 RepID=A0ABY8QUM9_9MICO|nr:hypothetical protein LWF01_02740 [Brevibacteriaceae bacterium ZFBP1038]
MNLTVAELSHCHLGLTISVTIDRRTRIGTLLSVWHERDRSLVKLVLGGTRIFAFYCDDATTSFVKIVQRDGGAA